MAEPSYVPHAGDATVVVYSRAGCHLCDVAEGVVADVCGAEQVDWVSVDIDSDPVLQKAFTDQVPVTFVGGRQHDFWRVDPARLMSALRRLN